MAPGGYNAYYYTVRPSAPGLDFFYIFSIDSPCNIEYILYYNCHTGCYILDTLLNLAFPIKKSFFVDSLSFVYYDFGVISEPQGAVTNVGYPGYENRQRMRYFYNFFK